MPWFDRLTTNEMVLAVSGMVLTKNGMMLAMDGMVSAAGKRPLTPILSKGAVSTSAMLAAR